MAENLDVLNTAVSLLIRAPAGRSILRPGSQAKLGAVGGQGHRCQSQRDPEPATHDFQSFTRLISPYLTRCYKCEFGVFRGIQVVASRLPLSDKWLTRDD